MEQKVLEAGTATSVPLERGQVVRIVNTFGSQVVDFWAFVREDITEFMSMEHTRVELQKIRPAIGDSLCSNRRRPILTLIEDSSPGIHDTTLAACDRYRYENLGFVGYHANCADNFASAVDAAGISPSHMPNPLNLWENAVIRESSIVIEPPVASPGDHVALRADLDLIVVFSACPQDMVPTNGAAGNPTSVEYSAS